MKDRKTQKSRSQYIYIYIFFSFFFFFIQEPIPTNPGSAHIKAKERKARRQKKRKGIEPHKAQHPTPSQATDVLTWDEGSDVEQIK